MKDSGYNMRHSILAILLAAACAIGLMSCNDKPKNYRFVKVAVDGAEQVEDITAVNDTDALKQYFNRMEKIIVENISKQQEPFKAMYVISPSGDTLNTDKALLESVMKTLPALEAIPGKQQPQRQPLKPIDKVILNNDKVQHDR